MVPFPPAPPDPAAAGLGLEDFFADTPATGASGSHTFTAKSRPSTSTGTSRAMRDESPSAGALDPALLGKPLRSTFSSSQRVECSFAANSGCSRTSL